ncbi:hypothetical protein BKA62DRAFT_760591 [Auriculariales sp. MPI-PUGE-AT-0066]|nr:hypothetical protein BKA62DRAFT_760591 [Auriculariales sp. MPI-PUGE-AT-0066]
MTSRRSGSKRSYVSRRSSVLAVWPTMHSAESKDLQLAREDTRKQISLKLVQIERSRRDEDVACKDLAAAQVKVATLEKQRAEIARKLESLQSDLAQLRIKADGLAMQALPDDLWHSIFLATLHSYRRGQLEGRISSHIFSSYSIQEMASRETRPARLPADVSFAHPGFLPWCPRLTSFTARSVSILSADLERISRALKVLELTTVPSHDDKFEGVGASDEPIILPNLATVIGGESFYRALGSNLEKLSLPALINVYFLCDDFSSLEPLLKAHQTVLFFAHALEIGHARNLRSLRVLSQEPHNPDPEFWQALAPVPSTDYPAPALTSVSLAWRKGPGLSVAQNICHQLVEFAQQRCEASRSVSSSSASAEGDSGRPVRLKNISLTHREDAVVIAESLQQSLNDIIRGISTSI